MLDRDVWGWYEQCIQCGYLHDMLEVVEAEPSLVASKRKRNKSKRLPQSRNKGD
jgi:hypothetical protein